MQRAFTILIILLNLFVRSYSQELDCRIQVSAPSLPESEKLILQSLQSSLYEFMNQRNWTNFKFKTEERIEANITITIEEKAGTDEYKGTLQVQSRRPVFNSSYNSPLINHQDRNISFRYTENMPLDYDDNTFMSNLTEVLAFYAYLIIGFDFDTFSPMGGTPYFEKAQSIVNRAQTAQEPGWKSFESQRNRYWIIENIFNSQYAAARQALYQYHRLGFDTMTENMELARGEITQSLELLQRVHRQRPGSLLMQMILTAKSDEFVNIYSQATPVDQNKAIQILTEIDPTNAAKYRRINQQQ
ncbi:MAG: DUF4835 family protein [Bacteroidetes bacterium]|nr:DUF4835 family protein [Bacteroidota bacterium]